LKRCDIREILPWGTTALCGVIIHTTRYGPSTERTEPALREKSV
jgi:hypothetical protein